MAQINIQNIWKNSQEDMVIGFALLKDKQIIKMEKGVNLDVRDIAKVLRKTNYDWALFHTRLASVRYKK